MSSPARPGRLPARIARANWLNRFVGCRTGRAAGFNFSTVLVGPDGSGRAHLTNLNKFRKYGIVVQAFNEKGPGPVSAEQMIQTLEDGNTALSSQVDPSEAVQMYYHRQKKRPPTATTWTSVLRFPTLARNQAGDWLVPSHRRKPQHTDVQMDAGGGDVFSSTVIHHHGFSKRNLT